MAVDRRTTERLARKAVGTYAEAERRLLQLIARKVKQGIDEPDWARQKLDDLAELRRRAEAVLRQASQEGQQQLLEATEAAWVAGAEAVVEDVTGDVQRRMSTEAVAAERRVRQLAAGAAVALDELEVGARRTLLGTYRDVIERAAAGSLTGTASRLADAQQALDELASKGIGTVRDRSGRRWELASYVEMATRTTTVRASVAGSLDRMQTAGLDLVVVSNSPRECELCRPWEGQVLSRDTVGSTVRRESVTTGRLVDIDVAGTVDEAMRAGLFHPNCTHNLTAYLPGATEPPTDTANPEGSQARAELRALERKVREWKRREAVALTPEAERKAARKVRDWQARIRRHVDAHPGLIRQRQREQITRAR